MEAPLSSPGLSFLECLQVKGPTKKRYTVLVQTLLRWCSQRAMTWNTDHELDNLLVNYFDELFFKGQSVEVASSTIAALRMFLPDLKRGAHANVPRSMMVIRTWRKRCPAKQRLPFPLIALMAMAGWVLWQHLSPWIVLKWLIGFRCYLRPGENDKLTVRMLVPPTAAAGSGYQLWGLLLSPLELAEPGKTGLYDEAVLIDTELRLGPLLSRLVGHRPQDAALWPFPASEDLRTFNAALTAMKLDTLGGCRYGLRHGGASEDRMSKRRAVADVMKRGRWRSDQSLRRYAKETRVLSELQKINRDVLNFGKRVLQNIEALLLEEISIHELGPLPRP